MRKLLPSRRHSESFRINHGGMSLDYGVTAGYYDDGSLGEVFITGGKSGQDVEAIARDGAVLMSLALQHGAILETLAGAITRDSRGAPSSVIGVVIDQLKSQAQYPASDKLLRKDEQSVRGHNNNGDDPCEEAVQDHRPNPDGSDGAIAIGEEASGSSGTDEALSAMEAGGSSGLTAG